MGWNRCTISPIDYITIVNGRRRQTYDAPATPWQRVKEANILTGGEIGVVQARIHGVNPPDLTRQINAIQTQLTELALAKTEVIAAGQPLDLESSQPSIDRLPPKKRKPHTRSNM